MSHLKGKKSYHGNKLSPKQCRLIICRLLMYWKCRSPRCETKNSTAVKEVTKLRLSKKLHSMDHWISQDLGRSGSNVKDKWSEKWWQYFGIVAWKTACEKPEGLRTRKLKTDHKTRLTLLIYTQNLFWVNNSSQSDKHVEIQKCHKGMTTRVARQRQKSKEIWLW